VTAHGLSFPLVPIWRRRRPDHRTVLSAGSGTSWHFRVFAAFAVFWRKWQDLAARLGMRPFERRDCGDHGMGFGPDVAWVVILPQETGELVPIEPAPAYSQAGEKFEFTTRENRHENASSGCAVLPGSTIRPSHARGWPAASPRKIRGYGAPATTRPGQPLKADHTM
jgi:hypothetical protein